MQDLLGWHQTYGCK